MPARATVPNPPSQPGRRAYPAKVAGNSSTPSSPPAGCRWPIGSLASPCITVPIAVHCLIAYGVQLTSLRVAVHSLACCFFYGAFVAKVLLVQSLWLPGWALPVAGGALAVVVGVLWYTSALWYYNGYRLPGT